MTIGIAVVARLAARTPDVAWATMTSTFSRTSSIASASRRSTRPTADRYSTWTFWPSTSPTSRSPWRSSGWTKSRSATSNAPIFGTLACCARGAGAATGRMTAKIVNASSRLTLMDPPI